MLLLYEEGLRVVIHTSNLIREDWHQKTQGSVGHCVAGLYAGKGQMLFAFLFLFAFLLVQVIGMCVERAEFLIWFCFEEHLIRGAKPYCFRNLLISYCIVSFGFMIVSGMKVI